MKKSIFTLLFSTFLISAFAQMADSVSTKGGNANDVYYSFANGIVKSEPNSNWDLAFEISGFSASILVNHSKGCELWQSSFAYTNWSGFDTASKAGWKKMYNSPFRWSLGAFNLHTDNNFDLGWGTYNPANHIVAGDSVFLLKLSNGTFKKISILSLTGGVYTFKYANIDGSNEKTAAIDKASFKNKNFGYYSFTTESSLDREPLTSDWDIVFTKYVDFIPTAYAVGGVWSNKGALTAEARNTPLSTKDFSPYRFSDSNSVIGYDWKTYNASLNRYDITQNLVYFVKTASGNYWKIYFTAYKGSSFGTYYFKKEALSASLRYLSLSGSKIYPNPCSDEVHIELEDGQRLTHYAVSDMQGRVVLTGFDNNFSMAYLKNGLYNLTLYTSSGSQNIKLVKSN